MLGKLAVNDFQRLRDYLPFKANTFGGVRTFLCQDSRYLRQCKINAPKLLMRRGDWRIARRGSVRTREVDMAVADGADAAQGVDGIPRCGALGFALNGALQALGVPGHHAVGEQCYLECQKWRFLSAFSGDADLPFIEHEGLRVEGAPTRQHMPMDPDGTRLPAWIDALPRSIAGAAGDSRALCL